MAANSNFQLTVIIPAYNEARYISGAVSTLAAYLRERFNTFEIIVVDDGSRDGTGNVVKSQELHLPIGCAIQVLINEQNSGKGYSTRRGALASQGDVILFMDADLSYDLEGIEQITRSIQQGADLAIGSRLVEGAQIQSGVPMVRSLTGRAFNLLVQLLLFKGVPDTQCGIKGFAHKAAQDLFSLLTVRTFGFDVELLYIARLRGYRIEQIPVKLVNYRNESRVSVWRDSWRMFRDVIKVRWQGMRGLYALQPGKAG